MQFFINSVLTPLFFMLVIIIISAFASTFCAIYQKKKKQTVTYMELPDFMANVWKGFKVFILTVFAWKKV